MLPIPPYGHLWLYLNTFERILYMLLAFHLFLFQMLFEIKIQIKIKMLIKMPYFIAFHTVLLPPEKGITDNEYKKYLTDSLRFIRVT